MIFNKKGYCEDIENEKRIEKFSQDRLIKICIDAGFLITVEVGQYFMTKDIAEFSQFTDAVACSWVHSVKKRRIIWTKKVGF